MSDPAKPITPAEAEVAKRASVPDVVIQIFNDLIVMNLDGRNAVVNTTHVFTALAKAGHDTGEVIANGWLRSIDTIYAEVGWTVRREDDGTQQLIVFTKPAVIE